MSNKLYLRIFLILLVLFIIPLLIVFTYKIKTGKVQETIAKLMIPKKRAIKESKENSSSENVIVVILNENHKETKQQDPIIVVLNENSEEITPDGIIEDMETEKNVTEQQNEENTESNVASNANEKKPETEPATEPATEPETNKNVNHENTYEKNPYYIKVNYTSNVVTVYKVDENGNYTLPYKAFICSTGTATPTSGEYKLDYKYRWLALFGDVYGQYCTRIVGNILFHSVPYLEKENNGSLEYWEYDKLRRGCIYGLYKVNCRRR